jgi:hypothetical protein
VLTDESEKNFRVHERWWPDDWNALGEFMVQHATTLKTLKLPPSWGIRHHRFERSAYALFYGAVLETVSAHQTVIYDLLRGGGSLDKLRVLEVPQMAPVWKRHPADCKCRVFPPIPNLRVLRVHIQFSEDVAMFLRTYPRIWCLYIEAPSRVCRISIVICGCTNYHL